MYVGLAWWIGRLPLRMRQLPRWMCVKMLTGHHLFVKY